MRSASTAHANIATARKAFNDSVLQNYIESLRQFNLNDVGKALVSFAFDAFTLNINFVLTIFNFIKTAKSDLEKARLDLDSHKNKMKNNKNEEAKAKELVEVNKFEAVFSRTQQESIAIMKQCLADFVS